MKALSLDFLSKLGHVIFSKSKNATKQPARHVNMRVETNDETTIPSVEAQRKAYTGNFFAGVHCVFDPRLFKVK